MARSTHCANLSGFWTTEHHEATQHPKGSTRCWKVDRRLSRKTKASHEVETTRLYGDLVVAALDSNQPLSRRLFHFIFLHSPLTLIPSVGECGKHSNDIFRNNFPNMPSRAIALGASLGSVLRPILGALIVLILQEFDMDKQKRNQSSLKMVSCRSQCASYRPNQTKEQRHIVEAVVLHPSETPCCILTHQNGRRHWQCRVAAGTRVLPIPSLHLFFNVPIFVR